MKEKHVRLIQLTLRIGQFSIENIVLFFSPNTSDFLVTFEGC